MAWKVQNVLELEIPAWKAQPAPPLWPMLWANWVNIWQFTKEFNEKTQEIMQKFSWHDMKVKCTLTIYSDRTFDLALWWIVTSNLLLWKVNQKKWSWEPNTNKIASLSKQDLDEIVSLKKEDMNTLNENSILKSITWTAKNMWIEVSTS